MTAKAAYDEHLKLFKDPAEHGKVEAYKAAAYNYLNQDFNKDDDEAAQAAEMDRLNTIKTSAKDALPTDPKVDTKLIDQYVNE